MLIPRSMVAGQVDQDALASDVFQANKFVRSSLPVNSTSAALTTGRIYAVCLGRMTASYKVVSLSFHVSTAASGAATVKNAFWGVCSAGEDSVPGTPPTITSFEQATFSDPFTTTGLKSVSFTGGFRPAPTALNGGAYLWVGITLTCPSTMPSVFPLCGSLVNTGFSPNGSQSIGFGVTLPLTRHAAPMSQGPDLHAQLAFQ